MVLLVLLLLPALAIPARPNASTPVRAAGPACTSSPHPSATYTVRVCLQTSGGTTLTGNATVTTTISVVSGTLPGVRQVVVRIARGASTDFSISLLTDYLAPWSFVFPTPRWVDGSYRLRADVLFVDGFVPAMPLLPVSLDNNVSVAPRSNGSWRPKPGFAGTPFEIAVVGDGAGGLPGAAAVGNLITSWDPNVLFYLGDVYNTGKYTEFLNYYEPTLGALKSRTNPVPGNHETGDGGSLARGYFDYWNSNQHYYSFTTRGWQFIGLDSTIAYGQTAPGTAQYEWLEQLLAASSNPCTIVFMHHPRWGLNSGGGNSHMAAIWELLVDEGVDLVLNAHEHNYQRWHPLDRNGNRNAKGPTQFTVGTGGHFQQPVASDPQGRVAARIGRIDGALRLILNSGSASFQYITTAGTVRDSGSIGCTDGIGASQPKITLDKTSSKYNGVVTAQLAGFDAGSTVTLRWSDGSQLGEVRADGSGNAKTTFRTPLVPLGDYTVQASDGTGNTASAELRVIPRIKTTESSGPPGTVLRVYFYGFEPGNQVEAQWYEGSSYEVLKTVTIAANGRATTLITVPEDATEGMHTLRGKVIGISRSVTTTFRVTAGGSAAEDPTATGTPTLTGAETATPAPDEREIPASPEPIATETVVDPATPVVPDPEPQIEASSTETTPSETATEVVAGPTPYPVAGTSRSRSTVSGTTAVDDDPATVWRTAEGEDSGRAAVLKLELEGPVPIGEVRLLPGPDGLLGAATVETSLDGETWTYYGEPDLETADEEGWMSVHLSTGTTLEVPVRYVRVVFVGADDARPLGGIAEIEVWPPTSESM